MKLKLKKQKIVKQFVLIFLIGTAFSQSFAQFEMRKHSINSGGTQMTGGGFEMKSGIGQVDASTTMSSADYAINGGYWHENNDLIFKNNFK